MIDRLRAFGAQMREKREVITKLTTAESAAREQEKIAVQRIRAEMLLQRQQIV